MKKLISFILFIAFCICMYLANNTHAGSDWVKERNSNLLNESSEEEQKYVKRLFNTAYPKEVKLGNTTLRRYKNSKTYYNPSIYPTGPPSYVTDSIERERARRLLKETRRYQRYRRYNAPYK